MADNTHKYGFRWSTSANGSFNPPTIRMGCNTSTNWQDDASGFSVDLNIGDPVKLSDDGGVDLANGGDIVFGVIAGFLPIYDPTDGVNKYAKKVVNQLSWGSNEENRPFALVIPADSGVFEIDCDDAVTATTRAAYHTLINNNANFACTGDSSASTADPYLDIDTVATTATLDCRIVGISPTVHNEDFSGNYVKLLVRFNDTHVAGAPATGSHQVGV